MRSKKLALLFMLALAGCASAPTQREEAPVVEQGRAAPVRSLPAPQPAPPEAPGAAAGAPTVVSPPAARRGPTAGPAVIALLDQARRQAGAGEGEQAAATLERALRIEPQNAWVWHRLAVLRLEQGRWDQAIDLATKSITLAGTDPRLLGGNWEVIARARAGKGDHGGAQRAHARAQAYFTQGR